MKKEVVEYALIIHFVPIIIIVIRSTQKNYEQEEIYNGFKSYVGLGNVVSIHNLLFLVGFKRLFQ